MAVRQCRCPVRLACTACLATLRRGTTGRSDRERIVGLEMLVQIPSLGITILQLIFSAVAVGMAAVASRAREAGRWP
jgi:hypothetical protein